MATDGDADRIGLYDEDGQFVDAHHIILLLVHYLHKYKKLSGKVAIAFSATDRIKRMAEQYQLPVEVTKIGFKYISEIMINEDVLVGGEESGGIAVKGHIPERDGIYDGLVIYEFMTQTGKSLKELCQEVYDVVGTFVYERNDLHIDNAIKEAIEVGRLVYVVVIPGATRKRLEKLKLLDLLPEHHVSANRYEVLLHAVNQLPQLQELSS